MTLPTDPKARKGAPVYSGFLKYFPRAAYAVAELSMKGNEQHNPGEPLHWAKGKSQDELDAAVRHMLEAGTIDTDGVRHSTKAAWRALANLEKELEAAELGISVEELNRRYKTQETAKSKAQPVVRHKTDAEYAKEPCIPIERNKVYRIVAVGWGFSPAYIGHTYLARDEDIGNGLTSDGYRAFRNIHCRLAPAESPCG